MARRGQPPDKLSVEHTSFKVTCHNCGTEKVFRLSDIIAAANLPLGETHLKHRISEPCAGCSKRIELEIGLELEPVE